MIQTNFVAVAVAVAIAVATYSEIYFTGNGILNSISHSLSLSLRLCYNDISTYKKKIKIILKLVEILIAFHLTMKN